MLDKELSLIMNEMDALNKRVQKLRIEFEKKHEDLFSTLQVGQRALDITRKATLLIKGKGDYNISGVYDDIKSHGHFDHSREWVNKNIYPLKENPFDGNKFEDGGWVYVKGHGLLNNGWYQLTKRVNSTSIYVWQIGKGDYIFTNNGNEFDWDYKGKICVYNQPPIEYYKPGDVFRVDCEDKHTFIIIRGLIEYKEAFGLLMLGQEYAGQLWDGKMHLIQNGDFNKITMAEITKVFGDHIGKINYIGTISDFIKVPNE